MNLEWKDPKKTRPEDHEEILFMTWYGLHIGQYVDDAPDGHWWSSTICENRPEQESYTIAPDLVTYWLSLDDLPEIPKVSNND